MPSPKCTPSGYLQLIRYGLVIATASYSSKNERTAIIQGWQVQTEGAFAVNIVPAPKRYRKWRANIKRYIVANLNRTKKAKEIAQDLGLSLDDVKAVVANLRKKGAKLAPSTRLPVGTIMKYRRTDGTGHYYNIKTEQGQKFIQAKIAKPIYERQQEQKGTK